ncbi:MAG: sodium-independent anion transporter [Rhizobiales bacterium NRL2]|jgi:SulP family sulfate permease|nr:MAG: sodium-independent anion transporter [Rhizobiales bacterium NRL2]
MRRSVGGRAARFLPILSWGREYGPGPLTDDLIAAAIVTVMLVPQSLAYAMLAGLPPEVGLYASILPLLAYALFGTSRTLAVGPVAVVSLMTAAAIGGIAAPGTPEYVAAAIALALVVGAMLLMMGVFRLGFLANFLSHPVISGFISASAILIALSQVGHLLGIRVSGHNLPEIVQSLVRNIPAANLPTLLVGGGAVIFLMLARRQLGGLLKDRLGLRPRIADIAVKLAPMIAVIVTTLAAWALDLGAAGVGLVGDIPAGLPMPSLPDFSPQLWLDLLEPAALIAVIGFVESVSVAQTLAARRRQRIDPDQELVGLGASNIAAAVGGGYPVTGGFARSIVNFDAGARTPAAGAFSALGIALVTLSLTSLLYFLPRATLAATIIVAVLSLVDLGGLRRTWVYSKKDFAAVAATILVTLGVGVEAGVMAGVVISLGLFLFRTSRPHMAVVGLVPGTEHFRNIKRHAVLTDPSILGLRVDESLYFANARFLEDAVYDMVALQPELKHVILQCSAVNEIDASALESLEAINERLGELGVAFHLSEVKGPVTDRLGRTGFLDELSGRMFLSHYQAVAALAPDLVEKGRSPAGA